MSMTASGRLPRALKVPEAALRRRVRQNGRAPAELDRPIVGDGASGSGDCGGDGGRVEPAGRHQSGDGMLAVALAA